MRAFTVAALFVIGLAACAAAQDQVARDLRVVAHYGSGHIPVTYDDPANGQIGAWYVRLDSQGVAKIEVLRNSPGKKTKTSVTYSQSELQHITDVITRSRFFELPSWLNGGISDVPGYSLEVTMGSKTHKVGVIAPGAFKDKKLLKRFTCVWVAVCRRMPPKLDDGATRELQERS
jgi:hypothetical protein